MYVWALQTKEVEDCKDAHGGQSPMALLLDNLQIDDKFTAVHCTWTDGKLLQQFVEKKGNVCICPLTEVCGEVVVVVVVVNSALSVLTPLLLLVSGRQGNLGDGFPVIASCLDRVCLGTDCNARIDMCEEMRWLEYGHRLHQSRRGVCTEATGETDLAKLLFRYATTNGAESLNLKVVRGAADGRAQPAWRSSF